MSAEILTLPGQPLQTPRSSEPQPDVIAFIEALLVRAKSGDIQAIAVATVLNAEETGDGWKPGKTAYSHQLMAAIGDLQFRYARRRHSGNDDA